MSDAQNGMSGLRTAVAAEAGRSRVAVAMCAGVLALAAGVASLAAGRADAAVGRRDATGQSRWGGIPLHFEAAVPGTAGSMTDAAGATETPTGTASAAPSSAAKAASQPQRGDDAWPYVMRGGTYGAALGARGALFLVPPVRGSAGADVLRMRLVGASAAATVAGAGALPGRSNYYIGNDPSRWATGVQHYAAVQVSGVYPGIDLAYRAEGGAIEYDFTVAAGADPRRIRLAFDGARSVRLDAAGNLRVRTEHGELVHRAPLLYQEAGAGRRPVRGRFVMAGAREVRFNVESYDRAQPLVIDPTIGFSTYLGGSSYTDSSRTTTTQGDAGYGIVVDASNSTYVTGLAGSYDFPFGPSQAAAPVPLPGQTLPGAASANGIAFVAKLNASGALVFATYLAGTTSPNGMFSSVGQGIALDGSGTSVYVTGINTFSDFPQQGSNLGRNCSAASHNDMGDAFIAKLAAANLSLGFAGCIGGSGSDQGIGVAVDSAGNAYVAGNTQSTDLGVANALQASNRTTQVGGGEMFIAQVLSSA